MGYQIGMKSRIVLRSVISIYMFGLLAACTADESEEVREPGVRPVKMLTLSPAGRPQTSRYPGVIEATEAIKLILGIGRTLEGRLLVYDALNMDFQELDVEKDPKCSVCCSVIGDE